MKAPPLFNALRETIIDEFPEIELIIPEMEPVYGSVLLGMDHLCIPAILEINEKFIQ